MHVSPGRFFAVCARLCLGWFFAAALPSPALLAQTPHTRAKSSAEYVPDRLIVRPAPPGLGTFSASAASTPAASSSARFATAGELSATASARSAAQARLGLKRLHTYAAFGGLEVLALPVGASLEGTRATLAASGLYAYVEPDYLHHISLSPNDPRYTDGTLWGLHNTGQSSGVADADIDAPEAWNIRTDASSVIVAVIDTGIRTTHQDLAGNLWTNPGEIAGNGIDDDGNGYIDDIHGINSITGSGNPADDHGHGTHCAGTIGGYGNNATGVVGVAWRVKLMGLKFLPADGGGSTSDAIECIDYARSKGAQILSNSWGGGGFSTALRDAIAACRAEGIVFVAAAGNESVNTDLTAHYPSSYELDNVVSVAATDRTDALASFSNRGFGSVHLGAPGVSITSSVSTSDSAYDSYSGTSMATPHVTGALALMKAQFPADTYAQLINRLLRGTDPRPALAGLTLSGGRLNLNRALTGTLATPPNDAFAGRITLPSTTSVYLRTSNQAATAEPGEPLHGTVNASSSIWFTWTAPSATQVTLSLAGSGFDTLLGVYTGSTVSTLTELAGNDNASSSVTTSRVTFQSTAGATYHIAIDGKAGASGTVILRLTTPPANDAFASASALNGSPASAEGTNIGASRQTGEPTHAGVTGGASVWWSWTATASGTVAVSTSGSGFDTLLGVYTGSAVNTLATIASNDDADTNADTSRVTFNAVAGVNYRIAVDGKAGATGLIRLTLSPPPTNDAFAARTTLPSSATVASGSNVGAGRETGEPTHGSSTSRASVWWTWTAPSSGTWEINTIGSNFDTLLGVYTGSSVTALTTIGTNDDGGGNLTSLVAFQAVAGTVYQIAVDGWGGETGAITLRTRTTTAAPANDAFSARLTLVTDTAGLGSATGDSSIATKESGEPAHAGLAGGRSIWWKWTAPATGDVVFDTIGSNFDTLLAAYTGSTVSTLTEVASNNDADGFQSRLTFPVTAGVTYQLAVDGSGGVGGSVVLSVAYTRGNQRPVVTAATLTPAPRAHADEAVSVGGVVVNDFESDATTLSYQWQSSVEGSTWADEANADTATLPPADAHAGRFWRCVVRANDAGGTGPAFTTAATGLERRIPPAALNGHPYTYDPALPLSLPPVVVYDRPLWINEFSQGPSGGTAEWVELLVLRTTDLRGYVLRDVSSAAVVTFSANALWASVPAGTLIVMYNGASAKDPALPADDLDLSDRDLLLAALPPYFSGSWPSFSNTAADGIVVRDASGTLVDGVSFNGSVVHAPALGTVGSGQAALFGRATIATIDVANSWIITSATSAIVSPGEGNITANITLVNDLRSDAADTPPVYSLSAGALPPGLALDPATGIISGAPTLPEGGFFEFTIRRTAANAAFVERACQLVVGDTHGIHRVPAGVTWNLPGPVVLTGALVIDGSVVSNGFPLDVIRTYAAWAALGTGTPDALADPIADADGDGHANLLEFALGGTPGASETALITPTRVETGTGPRLALAFLRQISPRLVTYKAEWSADLSTWHAFDLETHLAPTPSADALDGYEPVTVRAPDEATGPRIFLRLTVTE